MTVLKNFILLHKSLPFDNVQYGLGLNLAGWIVKPRLSMGLLPFRSLPGQISRLQFNKGNQVVTATGFIKQVILIRLISPRTQIIFVEVIFRPWPRHNQVHDLNKWQTKSPKAKQTVCLHKVQYHRISFEVSKGQGLRNSAVENIEFKIGAKLDTHDLFSTIILLVQKRETI